jgi:hypothetical protein
VWNCPSQIDFSVLVTKETKLGVSGCFFDVLSTKTIFGHKLTPRSVYMVKRVPDESPLLSRSDGSCQKFPKVVENDRLD